MLDLGISSKLCEWPSKSTCWQIVEWQWYIFTATVDALLRQGHRCHRHTAYAPMLVYLSEYHAYFSTGRGQGPSSFQYCHRSSREKGCYTDPKLIPQLKPGKKGQMPAHFTLRVISLIQLGGPSITGLKEKTVVSFLELRTCLEEDLKKPHSSSLSISLYTQEIWNLLGI